MKKINIIHLLVYIYLLLKPFYIFPSGSIQISDLFIIMAYFILVLITLKKESIKKYINYKTYLLSVFVFSIVGISVIYSVMYFRYDFLLSASFYIFDFMGVYVLYYCIKEKEFVRNIRNICRINILFQVIFYLVGLGTWYGTVRYMGTFNDPNQFAFFVFSSLTVVYVIEDNLKLKKSIISYIISIFLIVESGSTGMLLGTMVFVLGVVTYRIIKIDMKKYIKPMLATVSLIFVGIAIIILTFNNISEYIYNFTKDNIIINRVREKLSRANNASGNLLQERGYDKIIKYPYKMILGAGHGYNERYKTYHKGEIHATFPSILFYYGIVPFIILILWIWKNIKYVPKNIMIVYFSLLVESMTLLNQRQILFWVLIMLGSLYKTGEKENEIFCSDTSV